MPFRFSRSRMRGTGLVLLVAAGSAVAAAVFWSVLQLLVPHCPSQMMIGIGLVVGCSVRRASGADARMGPVAAVFCILACALSRVMLMAPAVLSELLGGRDLSGVQEVAVSSIFLGPRDIINYVFAAALAWLCVAGRADGDSYGYGRVRVRR